MDACFVDSTFEARRRFVGGRAHGESTCMQGLSHGVS